MKFEELIKEHQEFLIYSLSSYIKSKFKREEREQFIEPTYEEYKDFFDKFDREYEIIDGCPESQSCNRFSLKFKVVLEVE